MPAREIGPAKPKLYVFPGISNATTGNILVAGVGQLFKQHPLPGTSHGDVFICTLVKDWLAPQYTTVELK
jgi:hypothetical protein